VAEHRGTLKTTYLISGGALVGQKKGNVRFFIYLLFFLSGFPALIYQIVWQRSLFTIYGVNIESVTMVVTAFMLGLGLGSLLGGFLSTRRNVQLLAAFGLAELGIGIFGLISLRLFHWVSLFAAGVSPLQTGLISFALLLVPTLLMGCTLPLLVSHVAQVSGNMGQSVAMLYFVNTLGSAAGCFVAAKVTMRLLGQSGSVMAAVALNITVACGALILFTLAQVNAKDKKLIYTAPPDTPVGEYAQLLPFPWALVLVGLAGFISLGYEIIWYRVYSFVSGGEAKSFAYLLGGYLAGIAFGSLFSRYLCRDTAVRGLASYLKMISVFIILANLAGFLVAPLVALGVRFVHYPYTLPVVTTVAGLLGGVFPLICHVSVKPDSQAGARLSYLYLSNIVGCTLGSFLVGFVLMDFLTLQRLSVVLALVGVGVGLALLFVGRVERAQPQAMWILLSGSVLAGLILLSSRPLYGHIYERMMYQDLYQPSRTFQRIVETRSGVTTVTADEIVYGGGVYDGRFNTDPMHDTNLILRAYALSSFHPAPKQVLMIGLSSGSWAEVIANHPQLQELTIVEINPGYLQLIAEHPEVASLLQNPKVRVVIDDGHRWLQRNPKRKFDVIVMNTSYHWRAHMTNLLSVEFLRLIRTHLNPGGIHYYNTTGSKEVQITGLTVFPYGLRVANFLAVSDDPIVVDRNRWRDVLTAYRIEGKPVFDLSREEHQAKLDEILAYTEITDHADDKRMEYAETIRERFKGVRIITDDNMGTEWTYWSERAFFVVR
jgi:spermidine synthase